MMDFGAILAFILIFAFILAILVSIAYYGMNAAAKYPDESSQDAATAAVDSKSQSINRKQHRQKSTTTANGKVN